MKHPAIRETTPELESGSAIPWSAEREYRLRRRITKLWLGMWAFFIAGLGMLVMANFARSFELALAGVLSIGGGVVQLLALQRRREMLGEEMHRGPGGEFFEGSGMLANKPRSLQRLTKFYQHRSWEISFVCFRQPGISCGRVHHWQDAEWLPNYKREDLVDDATDEEIQIFCGDPGGGRFVILCPCGIGHFKLKLLTEQDIIDRSPK